MSEAKYTLEENGGISVQNLSAYWIPEMTIKEVIKGSTYTISGEYVGTECIVPKLKRIMAHDAAEFQEKGKNIEVIAESEEDLHDKSAE